MSQMANTVFRDDHGVGNCAHSWINWIAATCIFPLHDVLCSLSLGLHRSILFTLAKQSRNLGAYKLARYAYDKLQVRSTAQSVLLRIDKLPYLCLFASRRFVFLPTCKMQLILEASLSDPNLSKTKM